MGSFDPENYSHSDIYKLMVGAIVPRPIALVSTVDENGIRNLAPFSYFTAVCSSPPTLLFCPAVRASTQGRKDTLRNVLSTEEFVVNVVSWDIASQMNVTSAEVAFEVDEFELSGLTPVASAVVRAPRVAESPIQMECKLRNVVTISEQVGGASIVIGEIIRFHVREGLMNEFKIDPDKFNAIGRMGGPTYIRTLDRFEMERPKLRN
ncbi:Nitrilotriacetate monooxygenase component B [Acidisarcina polymorpha]|uniref:Nitrilotriacetate monooxygenase component B n=2 Tax=Acidisarcina polymorpha TaxID=2211140 RepID=A0A2Z5G6R1_9BACT|nr:Nitrilotriacetate monooxygenase component B [Acidisarcina polymorpha]